LFSPLGITLNAPLRLAESAAAPLPRKEPNGNRREDQYKQASGDPPNRADAGALLKSDPKTHVVLIQSISSRPVRQDS
jgi:hypothetical protein